MLSWGDFDTEEEFKAYCAARYIWDKRDKLTPSAIRRNAEGPTWSQWFKEKWGRSLEEAKADFLARLDP